MIGPPCPRHVSRSVRDRDGRELGYFCLECGGLTRRRGPDELLEAAALVYLVREEAGEVELGRRARARLQTIRRRLARRAKAGQPLLEELDR